MARNLLRVVRVVSAVNHGFDLQLGLMHSNDMNPSDKPKKANAVVDLQRATITRVRSQLIDVVAKQTFVLPSGPFSSYS